MRFMRLLRRLLPWAFFCTPVQVIAAPFISGCGVVPGLPCASGGAAGAATLVFTTFIPILQYIFYVVALAMFFYYAIRLVMESEDESTISETKSAYGYAVGGAAIVSLADNIIAAVGPGYATATLINIAPVVSGIDYVVFYMRLIVATVVTATITYQGCRMILLQGQESEMEEQKKKFFNSLIGVVIIQLAFVLVNAFLPGTGSIQLAVEIVGIVNFLLELIGALAILSFIVAGIMLLVSTNEELKDRAKKTMFTTVIALVLVLLSYVIVRFTINVTDPNTTQVSMLLP